MEVQSTRTSEARPKRKEKTKHVQNLENTLRIPLSPTFFRHYAFFWFFLDCTKWSPFICFVILQHNGCQKNQRVPLLHFSAVWHFKNHIKKIFWEIFWSQRVPPFTILSLRYGADFGRSRLVFQYFIILLFSNTYFSICISKMNHFFEISPMVC